MNRRAEADTADLIYDGTSYRIDPAAVTDLLARGVIARAEPGGAPYELSIQHKIDDLDGVAEVLARSDAPRQSRLRVILRTAGLSTGRTGLAPRKDYLSIEHDDEGDERG